jgi:hypothetical protein
MPFKSKAQIAYLYANKPSIAKEFAKKTRKGAKLPKRVKPKRVKRTKRAKR